MTAFDTEIAEQPLAVRRCLEVAGPVVSELSGRPRPGRVAFIARGSSRHAAAFGAYLLEGYARTAAGVLPPSLLDGSRRLALDGDWLAAVSQSGATPEVMAGLEHAGKMGALTILVTNKTGTASTATVEIPMAAGTETAVPATKTFTNSCLVMLMLTVALGGAPGDPSAVPDIVTHALAAGIDAGFEALTGADRIVVAGRGPLSPIAHEIALKISEAGGLLTRSGSANELLHGPIESLAGTPVMLLWHPDQAASLTAAANRFRETGSRVVTVGPGGDIDVGDAHSAPLSAFGAAVVGQRIAAELAAARGVDPDRPRHLEKVTAT